jgi:hypothetical protein
VKRRQATPVHSATLPPLNTYTQVGSGSYIQEGSLADSSYPLASTSYMSAFTGAEGELLPISPSAASDSPQAMQSRERGGPKNSAGFGEVCSCCCCLLKACILAGGIRTLKSFCTVLKSCALQKPSVLLGACLCLQICSHGGRIALTPIRTLG